MRTIKFRGKRVDNDEWVYGYYTFEFERDYSIESYDDIPRRCSYISNENGEYFKVIYETVGQFTGLFDKNGKEIYEGDIVKVIYSKHEENTIHEIKYFVDDYSYPAFDLKPSIDFAESNSLQYANLIYSLEIIGNIHDNKELLND